MTLPRKRRSGPLLASLIMSLIVSSVPVLDGCSHGEEQSAPAAQPTPAAAASPAQVSAVAMAPAASSPAAAPGPAPGGATAEQLQQLVAPIALYPDMLIAQILAASTYPTQVVEADRFMKEHPGLAGEALAAQINPQPWDPSVKSLCQFPSVLKTMSESLAWTSALGEAYYNQPNDVMAALQVMRKRAMDAGTLKSTPQQKVEVQQAPASAAQGAQQAAQQQVIVIQPAQPNTVYVPAYNPSTVYGAPVAPPPGYSSTEVLAAEVLGFGAGVLLGALINNGHNDWGCNWYGGNVVYNRNIWISNSNFVPARWGYPGYRPGYPGYRPGYPGYRAGYPGGYPPRPIPYTGKPPQFAANEPNFKPETLPTRPVVTRPAGRPAAQRRAGGKAAGNIVAGGPVKRPGPPTARPANNPMRGYGGGAGWSDVGGRGGGAFGGYQPGGFAQAASNRGRASFGGGFSGGVRRFGGGRGRR